DASDRRDVILGDGSVVNTTCYLRGEYDILAVPLFPFTGTWEFAYKRNEDCRACTSKKYTQYQQSQLLATTEKITWPLTDDWHLNLLDLLDDKSGSPVDDPDVITEPTGEVRIVDTGAMILPLEDKEV